MEDSTFSPAWWVRLGYPPFEAGEDQFPRPGQVVRHFRYLTMKENGQNWTQMDLAQALGVSDVTIFSMEKKGTGLDSYSRRRFLCEILSIPPVLLGLAEMPLVNAASSASPSDSPKSLSGQKSVRAFDLKSAEKTLALLWTTHHGATIAPALAVVQEEINGLYDYLPFSKQHKDETLRLLCRYHVLIGNVLRDQKNATDSLSHLNRAYALAHSLHDEELMADTLFRRSGIYRDGPLGADSKELLLDATAAQQHVAALPSALAAVVLMRGASAEAQAAQDNADRMRSLRKFDQATRLLRAGEEDSHYLFYDVDRLHIDKAWCFIDLGWYAEALKELGLSVRTPEKKRRTAFSDLLMAKAFLGLGNWPMAAACIQAAIGPVLEIQSGCNIVRMSALIADLQASPFGRNPEVARLVYKMRTWKGDGTGK